MADKPSRAIVLYGDGLARSIDGSPLSHLHCFASQASCGFLALPQSSFSGDEETRVVREFGELIDSTELLSNLDVEGSAVDKDVERPSYPFISKRFMGMKAALITEDLNLKSFGSKLGFTVFQWNELHEKSSTPAETPLPVSELLKLLGFQEGSILDSTEFELVIVHVGLGERINNLKDIEFVDHLVGNLLQQEQSNTDISTRLHTSIIMSFGAVVEGDNLRFSILDDNHANNGELSVLFPRQSYMMKGGKPRENIRHHCPMLYAQHQKAVTRKDTVESFSFRDFVENSGNLVIPADRFLHEVAFKLWKAPKYGA